MDLLKENYILGLSFAPGKYAFYRVTRSNVFPLVYNFQTELSVNPLNPYGQSYTGYSAYYLSLQNLGLPQSEVNTPVTDMFKIDRDNEIWQIFYGIAPSYLKVLPVQPPSSAPIYHLDQSITPSQTFIKIGFDGFASPFDEPSDKTEAYVLAGLSIGFVLINPVTIPISPKLKFIINRMIVEPITDPNMARAILDGKVPAHIVTIGSAENDLSSNINWVHYQKSMIFNVTSGKMSSEVKG